MRALFAAIALVAAGAALAHGPTRQKVTESVAINAPVDAVWEKVKNFDALQTWHPAVESSTTTDGNNVGSLRTLKLKDGGQIVEILEGYDAAEHKYNYRMKDPGPVPVNNYTSTITVKPGESGGSVVEWRGAFYRAYPNNDPPPEKNDEAAVKAVTGIYRAGLDNLAKQFAK
ncbi:MAG TPA: SRPBCC family protein [Burkholderiaceae bacterium]|nr:SRPBCC family protein [Burkholderiaceae bacterium]